MIVTKDLIELLKEVQRLYDLATEPKNQGVHTRLAYFQMHFGSIRLAKIIENMEEELKAVPEPQ